MTLTEAKDRIRRWVLARTARIIAEIDAYPDIAKVENWYLIVVFTDISDIIAYRHGLHFCREVNPNRNQNKV